MRPVRGQDPYNAPVRNRRSGIATLCVALLTGCGDDSSQDDDTDSASGFGGPSSGPSTTLTVGPGDSTGDDPTTGADGSTGAPGTSGGPDDETTTGADTAADTTGNIFGEDCIVFVDADGGDDDATGASWRDAKQSLVAALAVAGNNDCEVWIAAGTYYASLDDEPMDALTLFEDARVYGGFAGGETELEERDWVANPVVLSGDIGDEGEDDDNSFHVVRGADGARLDGVTVRGGRATDPAALIGGGGLLVEAGSMTVAHCIFTDNESGDGPPPAAGAAGLDGGPGGAIGFVGDDLTIEDCTFDANIAGDGSDGLTIGGDGGPGSAVAFDGATLTITDSTFTNNVAGDGGEGGIGGPGGGGAVGFEGEALTIEGSTFEGNTAGAGGEGLGAKGIGGDGGQGGAINARGGAIRITDTQFVGNAAGAGDPGTSAGGNGGFGGAVAITSYASLTIDHCDLDDNHAGLPGAGNNADGIAGFGGALYVAADTGDAVVAHSTFFGNTAGSSEVNLGGAGGAVALLPSPTGMDQGSTLMIHCTMAGNEASGGGALYLRSKGAGAVDVTGCAFGGNAAIAGGAVFYESAAPEGDVASTVRNSILWGDDAMVAPEVESSPGVPEDPIVQLRLSYGVFEGGCVDGLAFTCGDAMIDVDPQYADVAAGDLEALAAEIADVGDASVLPADSLDLDDDADTDEAWPFDLDDGPRVVGKALDLGAYEQD